MADKIGPRLKNRSKEVPNSFRQRVRLSEAAVGYFSTLCFLFLGLRVFKLVSWFGFSTGLFLQIGESALEDRKVAILKQKKSWLVFQK